MSVEAYLRDEVDVFQAARTFVQSEGFLPAPESAYAVKAAIDLALECKRKGEPKAIAFNISGHGFLDLAAYREKLLETPTKRTETLPIQQAL